MIRKTLSAVRLREKLAKRLDALERAADVGAISRGGAGDLVAEDVVERMPAPQDAADRELLWRAEFLRARLYRASARKSALDAATALLRAAEHEATLPPAPARSALVAPFARDLLERLRPLGSKRRAFRVFAVLADAVAVAPEAGPRGAELIDLAPAYLEGAVRRFSSAEIGRLLDKLQAALRRDAAPDAHARDRLQARLFRFALDAGDARRALDAWPGAAFVTPDDAERLARVAACAARFDDDVLAAIENGLRLGDAVRRRLERPLRDRARPAPDATEAQLRELEALNRAVARRYAAESWPWRHLAAIAARRDRPADAIAAFARLSDGAGDFEDAPAEIAPLLLRAGFRRVAAELGHEPTAALARAELALDADARAAPDALLDDLERLFLDDRVPRVLRNRAGHLRARLALAAGRADEAVDRLQRALSCDPSDGDLAGDLAEALLARGQAGRALAFVDVALERGETPRLLELKAGALEASGDVDGAAHALKRALDLSPCDGVDERTAFVEDVERAYARLDASATSLSPFLARLRADAETASPFVRRGLARPEAARRRAVHLADRAGRARDVLALLAPWRARLAKDEDLAAPAARAAAALGRPDDALALLAPHAASTDARIRGARGEAFAALGLHAEAARELEAARQAGEADRAAYALVRLDLMRGSPETALERCAQLLADPGLPSDATAELERLRADAAERLGDLVGAMEACARSLAAREQETLRVRFARLAVQAGLATDDLDARAAFLERAAEAAEGTTARDGRLWLALACHASARPAPLGFDEIAEMLLDPRVDFGPAGASRVVADRWLVEARKPAPDADPVAVGSDRGTTAVAAAEVRRGRFGE